MRQGNDVGTQYRSGFYYFDDDQKQLIEVRRLVRVRVRLRVRLTVRVRVMSHSRAHELSSRKQLSSRACHLSFARPTYSTHYQASKAAYEKALGRPITTEIAAASDYDQYGGLW